MPPPSPWRALLGRSSNSVSPPVSSKPVRGRIRCGWRTGGGSVSQIYCAPFPCIGQPACILQTESKNLSRSCLFLMYLPISPTSPLPLLTLTLFFFLPLCRSEISILSMVGCLFLLSCDLALAPGCNVSNSLGFGAFVCGIGKGGCGRRPGGGAGNDDGLFCPTR